MTVCVENYKNNDFYISLTIENRYGNAFYMVQVCPCFDDSRCGYPIKEMIYSIKDKKKAYATYRRYIKKYCQ